MPTTMTEMQNQLGREVAPFFPPAIPDPLAVCANEPV